MSPDERVGLIEVQDSVLVAIDVQDPFLAKLPASEAAALVARIRWLLGVGDHLGIPIVVTAEDLHRVGPIVGDVAAVLPADTTIFDKLVFGLAADPAIRGAIERTGRRTCILVGLELAAHVPAGQVTLHVGHRPMLPSAGGSRAAG